MRIRYVCNIKRGDVISWLASSSSTDTGHVLIAAARENERLKIPGESERLIWRGNGIWRGKWRVVDSFWVRVVDSSSNYRERDSRNQVGKYHGVGSGYINIFFNEKGESLGWRWRKDSMIHWNSVRVGRIIGDAEGITGGNGPDGGGPDVPNRRDPDGRGNLGGGNNGGGNGGNGGVNDGSGGVGQAENDNGSRNDGGGVEKREDNGGEGGNGQVNTESGDDDRGEGTAYAGSLRNLGCSVAAFVIALIPALFSISLKINY
jgi:hypothetical protein